MKKLIAIAVGCLILFSCGPKPQWKTREGKKKLKRYNSLQYNKADWDKQRSKGKKKKKNKNLLELY